MCKGTGINMLNINDSILAIQIQNNTCIYRNTCISTRRIEDLLNKFGYLIGSELLESLVIFERIQIFFFSDMAVAAEGLRLR